MSVLIKTEQQIAIMAEGGALLAQILFGILKKMEVGMNTAEIDTMFHHALRGTEAEPVFLGYRGFPKTICTSLNDEVVHGIPHAARLLHEGDIIGIDCGLKYRGWCLDMSRTVGVGKIAAPARRLCSVTRNALAAGIGAATPGNTIGDIGAYIQDVVERAGYSVVRALVGHGIGRTLHEEPAVPNYGKSGKGLRLETGMVLAIEPMVNMGTHHVVVDADGWTVRTADGTLSAHMEDTIAITDQGPRVLTHLVAERV